MAVRGHGLWQLYCSIPYIRRLDAQTLCSCCFPYLWSARLPHIYCHVIILPRSSPFFAFPFPATLKRARKRGRPGTEAMYIICRSKSKLCGRSMHKEHSMSWCLMMSANAPTFRLSCHCLQDNHTGGTNQRSRSTMAEKADGALSQMPKKLSVFLCYNSGSTGAYPYIHLLLMSVLKPDLRESSLRCANLFPM